MPPRLSKINLWKRHEERVCEVISEALIRLQKRTQLLQNEDALNRELLSCLREANADLREINKGVSTPFYLEARKQPSADHTTIHNSENKRPDLQNGFVDHNEKDPHKQDRFFHVECKRLGDPPSRSWILNEQYCQNGISRFVRNSHQYGRDVDSGAMIGYVESSDFGPILDDVNSEISNEFPDLEKLVNSPPWSNDSSNLIEQVLIRNFPISPFTLKHFWIDLRVTNNSGPDL